MSKKPKTNSKAFTKVKKVQNITEYTLNSNGMRVLFMHKPDTGIVTTNITYVVGARDEARGETGLAHMLEHMLFKPTKADIKKGIDSGAMQFEREIGCILNANTWKDRTTYYFSYPKEHFMRALQIEADRMVNIVIEDKELIPERNNVLSEFDMNNGSPEFALAAEMVGLAYHSHPYGHETIGYREDIEAYTSEKLDAFYKNYYRPDNATLMIVGDIDESDALEKVEKYFSKLKNPKTEIPRFSIKESKQEGTRRCEVVRPSNTNIVAIGFKHAGFPSKDWFTANLMTEVLVGGDESILHKLLVDTGKASSVSGMIEPTSEENLGAIFITLAPGQDHKEIESLVMRAIAETPAKVITPLVKKTKAAVLAQELFMREKSLNVVQELTEYTAAGDWSAFFKTPQILSEITTTDITKALKGHFDPNRLTIGYFIGKQK